MSENLNAASTPVRSDGSYSPVVRGDDEIILRITKDDATNTITFSGEMQIFYNGHPPETICKTLIIHNYTWDFPSYMRELRRDANDNQFIIENGNAVRHEEDSSIEITGSAENSVIIRTVPSEKEPFAHIELDTSVVFTSDEQQTTEAVQPPDATPTPKPTATEDPYLPPTAAPLSDYPAQGSASNTPEPTPEDENLTGEEDAKQEAENQEIQTTPTPEPPSDTRIEIPVQEIADNVWSIQGPVPVSFHADAMNGWRVEEENVSSIRIKSKSNVKAELGDLNSEQVVTISGGVCTKQAQEDGTALLFEDGSDSPLVINTRDRDEAHAGHEGLCVEYVGTLGPVGPIADAKSSVSPGIIAGALVLAALLGALIATVLSLLFSGRRKKQIYSPEPEIIAETDQPAVPAPIEEPRSTELFTEPKGVLTISYDKCQDIGKRSSQQDSFLLLPITGGVIGVVADGMGGLKDGDVVSKKIVNTIEESCKALSAEQLRGNLMALVSRVNDEVNRMLGPNELYKSGSTIVAALAEPHQFQWVSVGDSRIYLYRGGLLLQLNREHNYQADLLLRAVNHQGTFQEAKGNPKRRSVSSFIGMGTLKYVDEAQHPTKSLKGDRILICSDGVFNTLPEPDIEKILEENPDPVIAKDKLKAAVLERGNPHQDNFTAIIIAYE